MNNWIFTILCVLLAISLLIPVGHYWLPDKVIYGDQFCRTFDGRCVSTFGNSTSKKMILWEKLYWEYKLGKLRKVDTNW